MRLGCEIDSAFRFLIRDALPATTWANGPEPHAPPY
jgi:hypothetical protein